jgi:hypothetical protein
MNTGYPKRDVEKPKRRKPDPPFPEPPETVTIIVRHPPPGGLWYAHMANTPINLTACGKTVSEAVDRMFELIIHRGIEAAVKR